jgi:glyoxylase-like metal-dependent hydrolase (beta-lactamase superfamily II)
MKAIPSLHNIYALKYAGPFTSSGAFLMWLKDWEKTVTRNYYFWVITGNHDPVVVDAGVSPELARERSLKGYISPEEILRRMDMEAGKIRHVVLTHLHWDHASGISLFPNATVYIQEKEYSFWTEDSVASRPPFRHVSDTTSISYLRDLKGTGRLRLLRGDREILPGIECLLAPGHSIGLQAVAVETRKGTAILGSDCAHIFENYQKDWPSALIVDMVAWMKTYKKLKKRVSSLDLLFPGHDVRIHNDYPEIAKNITQLA